MKWETPPLAVEQIAPRRRTLRVAVVSDPEVADGDRDAVELAQLGRELAERDHEIQLVRLARPRAEGVDRDLLAGLGARRALAKLWSLRRPDLVHVATAGPLAWSAVHVAAKMRVPVCMQIQPSAAARLEAAPAGRKKARLPRRASPLKAMLSELRKFHRRARLTIVPTDELRRELAQRGFQNVAVARFGSDAAASFEELYLSVAETGQSAMAKLALGRGLVQSIASPLRRRARDPG